MAAGSRGAPAGQRRVDVSDGIGAAFAAAWHRSRHRHRWRSSASSALTACCAWSIQPRPDADYRGRGGSAGGRLAGQRGGLNLAAAGVQTEQGYITVDDTLRTSAPHIMPPGTCTGRMMLVQTAATRGRWRRRTRCSAWAASRATASCRTGASPILNMPVWVDARLRRGRPSPAWSHVVPYSELDRAVIDGHTEGVCKLIVRARHASDRGRAYRRRAGGGDPTVGGHRDGGPHGGGAVGTSGVGLSHLHHNCGLAARRIVRQLGSVSLAPRWRLLGDPGAAEWERRERDNVEISLP